MYIELLEEFRTHLLLLHTGFSRNVQCAVEQVYQNHASTAGKAALDESNDCGRSFYKVLAERDFLLCAELMEKNFAAQKRLVPASANEYLDEIYSFAKNNGAYRGKIYCAGSGGAFFFYFDNHDELKKVLKKQFIDCFETDFEFEYGNIKEINHL